MCLWNGLSLLLKTMIMSTPTKVVLDGTLFAECQMQGSNRDGMMRLTEDITQNLVLDPDLEITFASSLYIHKYDRALKNFIHSHYPKHQDKIFSNSPVYLSNILKWKNLFRTYLSTIPIYPFYKEINNNHVFHSFYYPFSSSVLKNKIKKSITFLDIIALKIDGYPKDLVQRTKQVVDSIAGNFAISISDYSKQDLLNFDPRIKEENIFVVPLAASKELFYQNKDLNDWETVKNKYALPEKYFLTVAGNDARKNVRTIILAFCNFLEQEKFKDIHLVLAGNNIHNRKMLDELNVSAGLRKHIYISNVFIDSKDLAVLYSNALCFFFISLYEGFGLPALEAMQCGTPTVVSNTTSLPEVVGNAAIQVTPTDINEVSSAMLEIYTNENLRARYAEAGMERAKQFSWQKSADNYSKIFQEISLR